MTVKELIKKLQEMDQETRVVVDTIEGFYDIYTDIVEGGTRSRNHKNGIEVVTIISLEGGY